LTIYTDHKPLTSAVSPKNTNDKIIRWKAFVDEHNTTFVYTPGKQNQVADALSRQNLNALEDSGDSDAATIHSEESLTYTIKTTDRPVNCFANEIVTEESLHPATKNYVLFQNKMRHIIQFRDKDSLLHLLRYVVKVGRTI